MERKRYPAPNPEIAPLPEIARSYENIITEHRVRGIAIVEGPVGKHFSNEELWRTISPDTHELAWEDQNEVDIRDKVNSTLEIKRQIYRRGIADRYAIYPPGSDKPDQETAIEVASSIGAHMLDRAVRLQNWDPEEVRAVINTSAVLPTEVSQELVKRSSLRNNPDLIISSHRTACAGVATGLIQALTDPEIEGGKVVIVATELLSPKFDKQQTYYNPQILKIFGDNFGALAFDTKKIELLAARTDVIPGGGIELETDYDLGITGEIPPHFRFPTGEKYRLVVNEIGVGMLLDQPPSGRRAVMKGEETEAFFSEQTPKTFITIWTEALLKLGVLEETKTINGGTTYQAVPGKEDILKQIVAISHDPSRITTYGIYRSTRDLANKRGIPKSHRPPRLNPQHEAMQRSNSSSATLISKWKYLAETGELDDKEIYAVIAPGIGAVIGGVVFRVNE